MNKYRQQFAKEFRRKKNNIKYFYLAKKKRKEPVPKINAPQQVEEVLPSKDRVLENLSGKLASVREITKNAETIKKPTKQLALFKIWLKEYEDQLLDEWNRANER